MQVKQVSRINSCGFKGETRIAIDFSFRVSDTAQDWRAASAHDVGVGAKPRRWIFLDPAAGVRE